MFDTNELDIIKNALLDRAIRTTRLSKEKKNKQLQKHYELESIEVLTLLQKIDNSMSDSSAKKADDAAFSKMKEED